MTPADIIKRPIALTEKAARLKEQNQVVFEVALGANKIQIKDAIQKLNHCSGVLSIFRKRKEALSTPLSGQLSILSLHFAKTRAAT